MSQARSSFVARKRALSPRTLWRRSTLTVSGGSRPQAVGLRGCPSTETRAGSPKDPRRYVLF